MKKSFRIFFIILCGFVFLIALFLKLSAERAEKQRLAGITEVNRQFASVVAHWPEVKLGMTKDEVRSLLGSPQTTNKTTIACTSTNVVSNGKPDPALSAVTNEAIKKFDSDLNYEIWSYHGVINTSNLEAAFAQAFDTTDQNGKLIGYSLKFSDAGTVKEISNSFPTRGE